ncbi:MAG TPA: glycosyltransferase [Thermoclostridium sp.]|nr:glycosyltransferase [Thermoclostridium sp.]
MYVLFISSGNPTPRYPSNFIFIHDQARALVASGINVVYASVDTRSFRRLRKWGIVRKSSDNVDIWTINIPLGPIPGKLSHRIAYWGLKRLYRTIELEYGRPALLHAHFANFIAARLKNEMKIPFVITEHFSGINANRIKKSLFEYTNYAYNQADKLIAVSPSLAEKIKQNFNQDATYIPNIVDIDTFQYKDNKRSSTFNFVSTGRLIGLKRMDLLIETFYGAFNNIPNVNLTIFGEGPERKRLEKIIDLYNLNDRVRLKGLCSRKTIADKYAQSDCFVLASQSETFGVAYIEALAMGLPVIATRSGGPEVFVNKNNGIMTDVDNLEQLTAALLFMYENAENYNKVDIAKNTVRKFSPESVSKQIIDVYKKVLSENE